MTHRMYSPPGLGNESPASPDLRKPRARLPAYEFWSRILCGAVIIFFVVGIVDSIWPRGTLGVRMKEAQVMANGISNSINEFYADYTRLPHPQAQKAQTGDVDSDTSPSTGLTQVLMGVEPEQEEKQNPRHTDYLEGIKPAKLSKKAGTPHAWSNGLMVDGKGVNWYSIVDFWGNFYRVRLDTDGDGFVENPDLNEIAEGRTKLKQRVIVWSPGRDGKEETWTDNPKSWD